MTITEIPSEDLEGQLLKHCDRLMVDMYGSGDESAVGDVFWMRAAVQELGLRRLARSAS